jgi:hypothetical protein
VEKKRMRHLLNGKFSPNKQVTVNVVDSQGNLLDSFATQGNVNELQQATSGYAPKHRDEARRLIGAANRRLNPEMIVDDCLFDGRNLIFTIRLSGNRRKNPSMFQNPERHSFTTRRGKRMNATVNQVLAMPQMFSDESIAHAERMADKWQMNANPSAKAMMQSGAKLKKGKGTFRQSNAGHVQSWYEQAESLADRGMGGYEDELLGAPPTPRFRQIKNPLRHASQVSQREKARKAQAQMAQAHRAALEKHYMSEGLSEEEALEQHAIDRTMRGEHYARLRANPLLSVRHNGGKTVSARFAGKCKATGEEYGPGESITKVDGVGWCLSRNV